MTEQGISAAMQTALILDTTRSSHADVWCKAGCELNIEP